MLQTQLMILVPARELAIQIEQVIRDMGTGFKVNAVYGGRSGAKEKIELIVIIFVKHQLKINIVFYYCKIITKKKLV